MGILNKLFGKKNKSEKEAIEDSDKAKEIWDAYVVSYQKKREIVNKTRLSISDRVDLIKTLDQIKSLISEELIDIQGENKTQEEIIKDLEILSSREEVRRVREYGHIISEGIILEANIQATMKKLYEILTTELSAIDILKNENDPKIFYEVSSHFWRLIMDTEWSLLIGLNTRVEDKSQYEKIKKIIHKIFLGKPLKPVYKLKRPTKEAMIWVSEIIEALYDKNSEGENLGEIIVDDDKLSKLVEEVVPEATEKEVKEIMNAVRYKWERGKEFIY